MTDPYELLHAGARKDHLVDQDEHMHTACYLSRALWHALMSPDLDMEDERDSCAMRELASMVAFHTSAAVTVMYVKTKGKADAPA